MKTIDRFYGELVMLFDRFLDAKDEDAGQARDAIHAAIKQDRAEALLAGEPERVDAGFDPQVHLLREFSVWLDEQSECHSDGELCFVCDQARCAPTCLRVRTLTLLAGAPSPEPARRRSTDGGCDAHCSLCEDSEHCWLICSTDSACDGAENVKFPPEVHTVAGESGLIWLCRHCGAWMECLPDDTEDETNFDAAWEAAIVYRPSPEPQPTAEVVAEAVRVFIRDALYEAEHYPGWSFVDDMTQADLAPILKTLGATT